MGPAALARLALVYAAVCCLSGAWGMPAGSRARDCDFGAEPGYWDNDRFVLFNSTCKLQPILSKVLELEKSQADLSGVERAKVLSIGDSLDRMLITSLSDTLGQDMNYYAPFKYKTLPSGRVKPEQTGKAARVSVGPIDFANFFVFGAGDRQYHNLFYKAAAIPALHNKTSDRICKDVPVFTKSFMPNGPDVLVLASNFWDAARWQEQGFDQRDDTTLREQIVDQYLKDVESMMDAAKKCFPHAKVYCWRTHPLLSTDDRNYHFWTKRPHVVAALNQAGRQAARERGWCLVDLDMMTSGHTNEHRWLPDGLHPSGFVMQEYANVLLNHLYQATGQHVPELP